MSVEIPLGRLCILSDNYKAYFSPSFLKTILSISLSAESLGGEYNLHERCKLAILGLFHEYFLPPNNHYTHFYICLPLLAAEVKQRTRELVESQEFFAKNERISYPDYCRWRCLSSLRSRSPCPPQLRRAQMRSIKHSLGDRASKENRDCSFAKTIIALFTLILTASSCGHDRWVRAWLIQTTKSDAKK